MGVGVTVEGLGAPVDHQRQILGHVINDRFSLDLVGPTMADATWGSTLIKVFSASPRLRYRAGGVRDQRPDRELAGPFVELGETTKAGIGSRHRPRIVTTYGHIPLPGQPGVHQQVTFPG